MVNVLMLCARKNQKGRDIPVVRETDHAISGMGPKANFH
jgi:hypothetical protein